MCFVIVELVIFVDEIFFVVKESILGVLFFDLVEFMRYFVFKGNRN